jgi:hypothetical protein
MGALGPRGSGRAWDRPFRPLGLVGPGRVASGRVCGRGGGTRGGIGRSGRRGTCFLLRAARLYKQDLE